MVKQLLAVLALAVITVAPLQAHEDEHHKSKHGGVMVESGHHHLEVVAKDGTLEIHVIGEDGKPEDVTGAKAKATILSDGKKVDVPLSSASDGVLKGAGAFKASKGATIIVTLSMDGHKPEQARVKLD
ncbi:conserved exported protein of unknown function [Candidatus Filomicrobium marinum]|uniref:Uncharacterized protein n=2 Tax=Filomicrobium TaxID=119044 RepID=A0A0D6JIF7_9HYPH|nr:MULTISPECIES: hypothetical protein [Filomicrobium]CFX36532.1 conserved exported protein of unknown function [Candidatus Filomicrobium marinum]CPR21727.1 conserved exported protein of unknown function [Candidatus Filomicrobium marinum]SDP63406.1 hypothetical protein SAMN04488061_3558 [Filomicrobium insigne]